MSAIWRVLWSSSLLLFFIGLAGCSKGLTDLEQYVEEVKSRKSHGIEQLPDFPPHPTFEYAADQLRDPFDASELSVKVAHKTPPTNSGLSPKPHNPQFLESFPLDTLRMVGTMSQNGTLWALIKTPDATIQRVTTGDYMGQNYGEIIRISATGIDISELIPDGFGGWIKREGSVALSE